MSWNRPGGEHAARSGREAEPGAGPAAAVADREPDVPLEIPRKAWREVLKGTWNGFCEHQLGDRAAALTYYGVLALFPAVLVLLTTLGLAGHDAIQRVLWDVRQLAPGATRDVLTAAVRQLEGRAAVSSGLMGGGLLAAVWSASGYVGAFIRASNDVYGVEEGRPLRAVLPLRLAMAAALLVLVLIAALCVVFTGSLARRAGQTLGIGHAAVTAWSVAEWPALALVIVAVVSLLYWAAPNVRTTRGLWWITPGSGVALLLWLGASGVFAAYIANFGSYNKTYGALGAVVAFLVWMWITNLAVLLGLEFNSELARQRAVAGGHPPEDESYAEPRSTEAMRQDEKCENDDEKSEELEETWR